MFERFTDAAFQVVTASQEEARRLNSEYIGTEHVLIGLSREPRFVPGRALLELGLDADTLRAEALEHFGPGHGSPEGQIPFTKASKQALEMALRVTLKLGHSSIESGHVLLGVIDIGPSPGIEMLSRLGVQVGSLRERVVALLANSGRNKEKSRTDQRLPSAEAQPLGREIGQFAAEPDLHLRRVLMAAAGRAMQQERSLFGIEDVLEELRNFPPDEAQPSSQRG